MLTLIELWVSFIYFLLLQNVFAEDYTTDRDFTSPGEMYDEDKQDEVDFYKPVLISLWFTSTAFFCHHVIYDWKILVVFFFSPANRKRPQNFKSRPKKSPKNWNIRFAKLCRSFSYCCLVFRYKTASLLCLFHRTKPHMQRVKIHQELVTTYQRLLGWVHNF